MIMLWAAGERRDPAWWMPLVTHASLCTKQAPVPAYGGGRGRVMCWPAGLFGVCRMSGLVGDKGGGGPGERLLAEVRRHDEPDPDPGDQADEPRDEGDHERAADVPVRPERHQPGRVAVA